MSTCYISIDVETSGPIPGPYFMMSLGAVAFREDGIEVGAFSRNLAPLDGSGYHRETEDWWKTQPEAWTRATENPEHPADATLAFHQWLREMRTHGAPVAVGYPILFDGMWVHWYLMHFVGHNPMSFSGIDMKTLAWTKLGGSYRAATKKRMPQDWFDDLPPHNHVAVDDAREQGLLFFNMVRA